MNYAIKNLLAALALLGSLSYAQLPVRSGDTGLFGLSYDFAWRGENITDAEARAHLLAHRAQWSWAPWEYLELSLAAGVAKYSTYEYDAGDFEGNWRFTPGAGLVLNSPALGDILRLRAAADYQWWYSEDADVTYAEHVLDPALSLVWNARRLDFEVGVLAHLGWGTMEATGKESDFSNSEELRGFAALSVRFPGRTFLRLYADASPSAEGWHGGPTESTLGLTFGWLALGSKMVSAEPDSRYFPSVPDMRETQAQMQAELDKE